MFKRITQKCYIIVKLKFLKVLMFIRQVHLKSLLFATIVVFLNKRFKFQPSICNGCRDILMMSMNLNDNAILNIYGVGYRRIINRTRKGKAVNLF